MSIQRMYLFLISLSGGIIFFLITALWGCVIIVGTSILSGSMQLRFQNKVIKYWARQALFLFRIQLQVSGLENLPQHGGGLLLFNHTSHLDILALAFAVPQTRFGAKIELFKIPIFGRAMRSAGMLPIARQNLGDVIQVYRDAEERARAGQFFALAPEGTRQDQEVLGKFKSGPFIFAINSGIPICPVIIKGAYETLPNDQIVPNQKKWKAQLSIHFCKPIPVTNYTINQRADLQTLVREEMLPYFIKTKEDIIY